MSGRTNDRQVKPRRLQVGGALNPRRDIYISRPEDEELFELLLDGQYANILTSRQTGKSSLVMSTIYRLRESGVRRAYVDLTSLGAPDGVERYYKGLLEKIRRDLALDIDLNNWWRSITADTLNQRLMSFFREVVCGASESPAVIVLDEIDSTLKLKYTDDLFTALRAMYNERPLVPAYERITFCLVGVATPNELIKERRTTAYNVGRTLELGDFVAGRDDLTLLAEALGVEPGNSMLDRVLSWTGGHPYLTMRVTQSMIERRAESAADVDRLIEETFQSLDRVSHDVHFEQILRFIQTRLSHGADSISLYQNVLRGERERDLPTLTHTELKLSGLVKRDPDGFLMIRNSIYERLFDLHWVEGVSARLSHRVETLEAQLRDRDRLAALGVTITRDERGLGNAVKFPNSISQPMLDEAALLFWAVELIVSLNLSNQFGNTVQVSDVSMLSGLTQLQSLSLSNTQVSDVNILSGLTQLQWLDLRNTQVSDVSMLSGLTQLQWLSLDGTRVTSEEVAALRQAFAAKGNRKVSISGGRALSTVASFPRRSAWSFLKRLWPF